MKRIEPTVRDKADLYRQLEDTLFAIALNELQDEQIAEMEKTDSAEDASERANFFCNTEKKALREIARGVDRANRRRFLRRTLPKAAKVAACLLLAGNLTIATALATSETVRANVIRFIANITPQYTELGLVTDDDASFDVPANWRGDYYLSYVPDGFEFDAVNEDFDEVYYRNAAQALLTFSENNEDTRMNIDTEGAEISWTSVHGNRAMVATKRGNTFVTWAECDKFLIVDGYCEPEIIVMIAENVRRIK